MWLRLNSCKCTLLFMRSFKLVARLRLMNCRFNCYEFKIYFMQCNWKSINQNYNFPPMMWWWYTHEMQIRLNQSCKIGYSQIQISQILQEENLDNPMNFFNDVQNLYKKKWKYTYKCFFSLVFCKILQNNNILKLSHLS